MSDIIIKENTVEMTIKYSAEFSTQSEMIEAVNGAAELRGLMSCDQQHSGTEEVDEQVKG